MSSECVVTPDSSIVASPDVIHGDVGGEVVMLEVRGGIYYGLEGVGSAVWGLIQKPRTFREIHQAVLELYDIDPESSERDLKALVKELASHGLVKIGG